MYTLIYIIFTIPVVISTRSPRQSDDGFQCTLPSHPANGKWAVLNALRQYLPGDSVDVNSIIRFECHPGYKLIGTSAYAICNTEYDSRKVPECGKLCPPLYSNPTTILNCTDRSNNPVNCTEATAGTYLSYTCAKFYEPPLGYKKNNLCSDVGLWNLPSPVCQAVCGRKIDKDSIPLIFGGNITEKVEYPWIAAVYQKNGNKFVNVCGGTIISRNVILTAAHCVTNKYGDTLSHTDYKVGVGKIYRNLRDSRDPNAQYIDLSQIISHPQYKGESRRFLADIALMVTKRLITLNEVVQPVCISNIYDIQLHVGHIGEIAGWGMTEDGVYSDELRSLQIPYKYETTCAQELDREWADKYYLGDKMCAGFYRRNISVCKGDSGSGLVFKNTEDNRYYIHGIVSLGPSKGGECNSQQNSLYTRVASYYTSFIDREITWHYADDCTLPHYPNHGRWEVVTDKTKSPGDVVSSTTQLKVLCDPGYSLLSSTSVIDCVNSNHMPVCQKSCLSQECNENISIPDASSEMPALIARPSVKYVAKTKVLCSYAGVSEGRGVRVEDLDTSLCTHMIFAYVGFADNGQIKAENPSDFDQGAVKGVLRRFTELRKKNSNLTFVLKVGGRKATSPELFSSLVSNRNKIRTFIDSSVNYLKTYNFNGLNIEWDAPNSPSLNETDAYTNFLRELKKSLKPYGFLLSASVRFYPNDNGYNGAAMNEILDFVIVNSYDMYGFWSGYTGQHSALYYSSKEYNWEKTRLNIDASAKNWLKAGISRSKLVMSVAFFGRSFTLQDKNQHGVHAPINGAGPGDGGFLWWSDICENYENLTKVMDTEQKNPYSYNGTIWIAHEDKDSVWEKAAYVKEKNFYGINLWPVDGDDVQGRCGRSQHLLKHIHGGLGNIVSWDQ